MKTQKENILSLARQIQRLSNQLSNLLNGADVATSNYKNIGEIKSAVVRVTGITRNAITSPSRVVACVQARILLTGIARGYGHSLVNIAKVMGDRHHATVLHQEKRYHKLRSTACNTIFIRMDNAVRELLKDEDVPVLSCCGDDMTGLDVPICPTCKEWQ